jgi:hypothetical protein
LAHHHWLCPAESLQHVADIPTAAVYEQLRAIGPRTRTRPRSLLPRAHARGSTGRSGCVAPHQHGLLPRWVAAYRRSTQERGPPGSVPARARRTKSVSCRIRCVSSGSCAL